MTIIRKTRFDEGGLGGRTRRGITLCPFKCIGEEYQSCFRQEDDEREVT